MDAVFDNIVGPAIGGAVGLGAWIVGETVKGANSVVDFVGDVIESFQPNPYEEWLNAPVQTAPPTNEFRNPSNETTDTGLSAAEIISAAGIQETITGTSSPGASPEPENLVPIKPAQQNNDPQAPLTSDFQDVPVKRPASSANSNVLLDQFENTVVLDIQPPADPAYVYPVFRGQEGTPSSKPYTRFLFSAVPSQDEEGNRTWKARGQTFLNSQVASTWEWDAGSKPPSAGELKGVYSIPAVGYKGDWFDPTYLWPGGWIRRFSLSEPVDPPLIENPLPLNEARVDVFTPTSPTWESIQGNAPGAPLPPGMLVTEPSITVPPFLPGAVPTLPNNPTATPPIGTDGNIVPQPSQVPTVKPDVHYVHGQPFNSGGVRKDLAGIAKEVGRIEQKAAATLDRVGPGPGNDFNWTALWLALEALAGLFEQNLPEETYTMTEPCTPDGETPRVTSVTLPPEKWAQRLVSLGDMMPELLQAHKDYKQPTCSDGNEPTIPEGDFRTISFRSDETSPYGKSRLRKRFRYRSVSGNDLGAVVDHWKDFSFEGGPYRVRWVGGPWRSPEIWAASEAEGQRVIQHAAEEAGVSPLESGRWSTRLSSSGRQGVPGTMRVDTTKGFYWITARDGSSERPIVAKT